VVTPFTSVTEAINYLAAAKNSSKLLSASTSGSGSGLLDDMHIGADLSTIYRFVSGKGCNSLDDIKLHFDLPNERAQAKRMLDVCKSEAEDCIFKDMREGWSDEELCDVAKAHAETGFTNIEELKQFIKAWESSKLVPKDRQYSNLVLKPTPLGGI
jgi:hypothetical protein